MHGAQQFSPYCNKSVREFHESHYVVQSPEAALWCFDRRPSCNCEGVKSVGDRFHPVAFLQTDVKRLDLFGKPLSFHDRNDQRY
jgi:hypothetical protein